MWNAYSENLSFTDGFFKVLRRKKKFTFRGGKGGRGVEANVEKVHSLNYFFLADSLMRFSPDQFVESWFNLGETQLAM